MVIINRVFYLIAIFILGLSNGWALQINNVSAMISPDKNSIETRINNDSDTATFLAVKLQQVSSPAQNGRLISNDASDQIVISKNKMLIPAQMQQSVSFRYIGPADNQERYYRILWYQESIANQGNASDAPQAIQLETILVVNPRQDDLRYSIDKGMLSNDGNSSFKAYVHGTCRNNTAKTSCQEYQYFMPGWKKSFSQVDITKPGSSIIIQHNGDYISAL